MLHEKSQRIINTTGSNNSGRYTWESRTDKSWNGKMVRKRRRIGLSMENDLALIIKYEKKKLTREICTVPKALSI